MALSAILDPAGEAIAFAIRDDAAFGRVLAELVRIKQGRYGVPRVVAVDRSEPRTLRLPIIIDKHGQGVGATTDADLAAAELATIDRLLARSSSLYVKDAALSRGITLRTLPSPGSEVQSDPSARVVAGDGVLFATLEIVCEPYAYGSAQTLVGGIATALPALIDLSAMGGSYETPLSYSLALADMRQVFLGLIEEEYASWSGWLIDANDLAWDTGSSLSDANAAGGMARRSAAGGAMSAAIATSAFPRGEYAFLARLRVTSGSAEAYCNTLGSDEAVDLTLADWRWIKLGHIVCPTRRTLGAGSATTTITIDAGSGAYAWCDRIAFVRSQAGYLEYDGPAIDAFAGDGEHIYVDGLADYRHVLGGTLYALRGRLAAIVETDGKSGPALSPVLALSAESRHNLWR